MQHSYSILAMDECIHSCIHSPHSLEWWKVDQLGFHLFFLKGCRSSNTTTVSINSLCCLYQNMYRCFFWTSCYGEDFTYLHWWLWVESIEAVDTHRRWFFMGHPVYGEDFTYLHWWLWVGSIGAGISRKDVSHCLDTHRRWFFWAVEEGRKYNDIGMTQSYNSEKYNNDNLFYYIFSWKIKCLSFCCHWRIIRIV